MEPAMSLSSSPPTAVVLHLLARDPQRTLCGLPSNQAVLGSYCESLNQTGDGFTRKIAGISGRLGESCWRCLELQKPTLADAEASIA